METREELTSIIGGLALRVIFEAKPSIYIPFKGKFPMVPSYNMQKTIETLQNTRLVKDLPKDLQQTVIVGAKMAKMQAGFIDALSELGIDEEKWKEMDNSDKANYLIDWMDKNNLGYESLKIEVNGNIE